MSEGYRVLIQEAQRLVEDAEQRIEHYRTHVRQLQRRGQETSGAT